MAATTMNENRVLYTLHTITPVDVPHESTLQVVINVPRMLYPRKAREMIQRMKRITFAVKEKMGRRLLRA
jgi:hypothetical protein